MAVNGPHMITAVLEHLRPEDVELLLANRGLPSVGGKEELAERLQSALKDEICEWDWEAGDVPEFHCGMLCLCCERGLSMRMTSLRGMPTAFISASQPVSELQSTCSPGASHTTFMFCVEMVGAGASMATHNNCIYVFGGMDEERAEHMYLWRWDLSSEAGFEPITHRYVGIK